MERLEEELRRILARRPPPAGLTARVMRQVRAQPHRSRVPLKRWAVAAALAAALLGGAYGWRRQAHYERRHAQEAGDQLLLSLQIAGSKVEKAREVVLQTMKENVL
jgi:hypothetical protein